MTGGVREQPLGGPGQMLDYLNRYTHRVAISNERLASLQAAQVACRVRDKDHAAAGQGDHRNRAGFHATGGAHRY